MTRPPPPAGPARLGAAVPEAARLGAVRGSGAAAVAVARAAAAIAAAAAALAAVAVLLAGRPALADSDSFTPEAESAAARIDADTIRSVVAEIASDRYEGRAPGTDGDRMTEDYLVHRLESLGFRPGGPDGGWRQPFDLVGVTASPPPTWRFTRGGASLDLAESDDFIAASGVQREQAEIDGAEIVFAGYGIVAPEYGWDDFKDADVRGKVVLLLNNDPDWDPELFAGPKRLYYGRWTYKYESAARHGAAGAIIVHTDASAGYPWQVVQTSWSGTQYELPAAGEPSIEIKAWVTEPAAERLVRLAGLDLGTLVEKAKRRDFKPIPLGVETSLRLENTLDRTTTANVVGVLPGSDPKLADEYVVYTAHHDHLGVGRANPRDPDDRIYNGARDNASGVGMVLAIGRAYAALPTPPRRSIMLLFVGAEEAGLLGSQYFAAHPLVPPGRIAADVNYDSGNIWGATRDITFIGLGKSTLDAVALRVAEHQGRVVAPDAFPDRGYYYRSDQLNFAKIGVPSFYLSTGTDFVGKPVGWGRQQIDAFNDRHYHQPSDELREDWSFDGMVQDARFGFLAGLVVANADELPSWKPGDEFEAARRAALEALGEGAD
ncbi:MAG TPA: M28 family peptidase [Gammaproteobacteria bacterium]|nr:M28 family peptidase [Gammaproteobacteria bacterium]